MLIENWTAFAVLVLLCVLIVLMLLYIIRSLRQWQPPRGQGDGESTLLKHSHAAHLQIKTPLPDESGYADARALWETLTKREKQVARLAAQKLTDAQIAAQLHISERTVGNHLYSIYSKLEINSRHELKFILRAIA